VSGHVAYFLSWYSRLLRIVALIPGPGDILNLFLNYWLIVAQAQKTE
jgi:hypothetical protein